jgi:hypothetical protein
MARYYAVFDPDHFRSRGWIPAAEAEALARQGDALLDPEYLYCFTPRPHRALEAVRQQLWARAQARRLRVTVWDSRTIQPTGRLVRWADARRDDRDGRGLLDPAAAILWRPRPEPPDVDAWRARAAAVDPLVAALQQTMAHAVASLAVEPFAAACVVLAEAFLAAATRLNAGEDPAAVVQAPPIPGLAARLWHRVARLAAGAAPAELPPAARVSPPRRRSPATAAGAPAAALDGPPPPAWWQWIAWQPAEPLPGTASLATLAAAAGWPVLPACAFARAVLDKPGLTAASLLDPVEAARLRAAFAAAGAALGPGDADA